ncbi:hypothetical protein DER46DRAFT_242186 [Fusarium sp. MPI-SDFR-AT-0072]|nr:hypothetical protein DER46DRAFT_242186 [Fusarium sp. MPI-SDFR-AT-0072]
MGYYVVLLTELLISCLCSPSLLYSPFLLICDSFPCSRRVFKLAFILFYILIVTFLVFVFGRSDTKNSCYNIIFNTPGRFRFALCPLLHDSLALSRFPRPVNPCSLGQLFVLLLVIFSCHA